MENWEYELIIGAPDEVKQQINRLGAFGWEIASTDILSGPGEQPALVVYMKRGYEPEAPEAPEVELADFPHIRPHT